MITKQVEDREQETQKLMNHYLEEQDLKRSAVSKQTAPQHKIDDTLKEIARLEKYKIQTNTNLITEQKRGAELSFETSEKCKAMFKTIITLRLRIPVPQYLPVD